MVSWREEIAFAGTTYWQHGMLGCRWLSYLESTYVSHHNGRDVSSSPQYTNTSLHYFVLLLLMPPYHLCCYWYAVGATAICIVIDDKRMKQRVGPWSSATGRIAGSGQSRGRHNACLSPCGSTFVITRLFCLEHAFVRKDWVKVGVADQQTSLTRVALGAFSFPDPNSDFNIIMIKIPLTTKGSILYRIFMSTLCFSEHRTSSADTNIEYALQVSV
jgi:hypothetical protein